MAKLTIEDLKEIRETAGRRVNPRKGRADTVIHVHMGDCGLEAGGRAVMTALLEERARAERPDILIIAVDCDEPSAHDPMITVQDKKGGSPVRYGGLDPEKASRIFKEHVIGGTVQDDLTITDA